MAEVLVITTMLNERYQYIYKMCAALLYAFRNDIQIQYPDDSQLVIGEFIRNKENFHDHVKVYYKNHTIFQLVTPKRKSSYQNIAEIDYEGNFTIRSRAINLIISNEIEDDSVESIDFNRPDLEEYIFQQSTVGSHNYFDTYFFISAVYNLLDHTKFEILYFYNKFLFSYSTEELKYMSQEMEKVYDFAI